jgi:chemotaxis protein MotB
MKKFLFLAVAVLGLLTSCNKSKITQLEREVELRDEQIEQLEEQVNNLQYTNSSLLDRMSDLSIVNKAGAESIQQSLQNINKQYDFIQDLTTKVQSKDSLNLSLVMNLKRSLADINDQDIQVEVKGGVVYVSISDRLLFGSGSATVTEKARDVLGKVATVINDHDDLQVMVEGHTDDVPIQNSCLEDNWDLSVKRATSVVRILQEEHYVAPERLIASGRSEYMPQADNMNNEGRSFNRRTEIIITPRLDQFFKLLEAPVLRD